MTNTEKTKFFLPTTFPNIFYLFNYITFDAKYGIIKNNESIKKILDCIFIVLAIDRSGMGAFCCRWNCRRNCDCWILGISK